MKITTFAQILNVKFLLSLTTCLALLFSFHNAFAQNQTVQLQGTNLSLKNAFKQIEQQTALSVDYNSREIADTISVPTYDKAMPVKELLSLLLKNTDYEYSFEGTHILVRIDRTPLVEVKGQILDHKDIPIAGVNVLVVGKQKGTTSDETGNYSIQAEKGDILEFSFLGFKSRNIKIQDDNIINVILQEDTKLLDEVVVVGYGTQKKVNLTGSVSAVNFDEEMNNRPITDASQALSGKVTGVWVSQNSGKPGSDGAQLRIRGWGTLNNSEPLVIIDGVEGVFSQVNPSDIESISVLKDAASAAIYGSKAANGVILVTTKTGKNNEKTQVELNSYVGWQELGRRFDLVTNSAQHMRMANEALINNGESAIFPETLISNFENGKDKYKYPNTDWYDYLYRKALITEHNVSVRGGSEKLSSFLSVNYLDQEGILVNSDSNRYGVRTNVEYTVNSWFKIGARMNYMHKKATEPFDLTRVFDQQEGATPFIAPYTRDGEFGAVEAISEDGTLLYTTYQPLVDAENGKTTTTTDYMALNVFTTINFTKNLNLLITGATNNSWEMTDKYNETLYAYTDSGIQVIPKNFNRDGIVLSRSQITTRRNNFQATLNYSNRFAEKHYVSGVIGMQLEDYTIKNSFSRRTNPVKEGLTQVDAGTEGIQAEGNKERLRMASYFGRINYSYNDKYLFEIDMRADASSRFKRGNRWGVFPGFSAGWRLGEEDFIKDLGIFSNIKLRASWGQLGNQEIGDYWPYLTVITQNYDLSYNYGGSLAPGAALTSLVDEDITWETTTTWDVGLDLGFLDGKLNIETDYFDKTTKDIIVQLPIANVLGDKTAPYQNVGKMNNKGIELVVNYDNHATNRDQFGYNLGLNLTYINNKVTKFQGGDSPDQLYLIREGYSYKSLYGFKAIGIYQSDEEALQHMSNNGLKPQKGNIKYEDVNNDGKLDYQDKQGIGNTIPKLTYGISGGFSYKGFDLNFLFQGIGEANAFTKCAMTRMQYEWMTISKKWENAWSETNTDSKIPMLRFDSTWDNYESSFWVHRIDFLKLKNLQLGYTIPKEITSKIKIQRLYLYANAQNLFTIMWKDGYEGYDPERNTFDEGVLFYPTPRIYTFGININF